jgi:hypothetical protein
VGIKKTLGERQICASDEEMSGGLCYKKCKAGYKAVGPVCWATCPAGMTDMGVGCQKNQAINRSSHPKPLMCPTDKDTDAALCYTKCRDGYKGVGPICWKTCPTGMTDVGVSCQKNGLINRSAHPKPLMCKAPEIDEGGLCYPPCTTGYKGVGPICWGACPADMKGEKGACMKGVPVPRNSTPAVCKAIEVSEDNLCFTKCKDGHTGKGPTCVANCPTGMTESGTSCVKRTKSRGDGQPVTCGGKFPDKIGDMCYGPCPDGFKADKDQCIKQ